MRRNVRLLIAFLFVSATAMAGPGPTLILPGTISTEATGPGGSIVVFRAISDGVTIGDDEDGRGASAVCSQRSGTKFPIGTTTVTCTAINDSGQTSTGTFLVNVVDTTAPSLTLPNVIEVTTTGSSAVVTWSASAYDLVDGSVAVACTPPSGSTFATGTSLVECSATDAHGNNATDTFEVTVAGSTPAVLHLNDQSAEATGPSGAVVVFDFIDQLDDVVCTPSSGTLFAVGATPVNCTKGALSGSFTVNVVDTTPPTLTLPADITAEATSSAGAAVSFSASATDVVDGAITAACTPPSGSTFALGTTAVQCSATDAHGNTTNGSFNVTVVDTTPPVIVSVSVNPATLWPPNKQMVTVTATVVVEDAGDPAPLVHIINVTASEPIAASDWVITGPLTVDLRSDRLGTSLSGRIYTIYIEAIDASGNATITTTKVTVPHDSSKKRSA